MIDFTAEYRIGDRTGSVPEPPGDAGHAAGGLRGGGDGRPAVAFMSALFAGGWIWEHPYRRLGAAGWPVIRTHEAICALDRQVAGSIEQLGDALLRACDAAGADDVIVCANSLGGLVAIDLAGRYPDRVRGIVVSGAPGLTADPDVGLSFDRRGSVRPFGDEFGERMVAALFHGGRSLFSDERMSEVGEMLRRPEAMVSMARSLKATRRYSVRPAMDKVRCPSLYAWGRHDRMTPVDPWLELLADYPGNEVLVVEGSGHIPMVERAEEYTGALESFVTRCAGALA
ncbi:alpha/beta hydrolase [Nonomuraea sp. 3-1Str]|uniref:alpha/beta fold hydrolase n=1 Tax=unclassified Nonomuraea TaxID=2593643 RepID=UPI0028631C24|nr:alpha/beta hydrolase [Nonomuraea sp. 3-1Str]MDR8412915.1 alpha/beta hydrolase [Nonomuraea sp. 3-1Str]